MNLECKTPPYLHVHMTELRRGIDGVNVSDGRHSDVLPGPHLCRDHPSQHQTCWTTRQTLFSPLFFPRNKWLWRIFRRYLPFFSSLGLEVNDLHHNERVEAGERDEMPSKEEGTSNTKYSWKVESR